MYSHNLLSSALWLPLILWFSAWSVHGKDGPEITPTKFETAPFYLQYFEDSDVVLLLEQSGKFWRSDDAGVKWHPVDDVEAVASYWMHPTKHERAYALGREDTHWFTVDKGKTWEKFSLPDEDWRPSQFRIPLALHAVDPEKVIFHAQQCEGFVCQEQVFYTKNDFKDIKPLKEGTRACSWAASTPESPSGKKHEDSDRIICIVQGEYGNLLTDNRILYTDNYFEDYEEPPMKQNRPVRGFINLANVKGYIIAAAKSEGSSELSMYVSQDGSTWHQAEFPPDHKLEEEAYTVLESTNYSIQVDVMTTSPYGPMGVLFSSNSNGTYFTENIRHTNRNLPGIVDFEKMTGIQGIVFVNVVKNWEDVERNWKNSKQVTSRISFDDGHTFKPLKDKDSGKDLHLHSVTDMSNSGRIFSSPAPGIVMGIGNTGDYLKSYTEGDLWVSDNAGITWNRAQTEAHKYEFGDQGALLVAIFDEGPTDQIIYSKNHGKKWDEKKLPDGDKVTAGFLTTIPDSTSQKFILAASKRGDDGGPEYLLYSLDFNGIYEKQCEDDDFEEWNARINEKENPDCLMGHTQTYRRRKWNADCYVGNKYKEPLPEAKKCECTWEDYECDFNFKPDGEGKDKKCIPAFPIKAPSGSCKDGKSTFKGPSGFRKIPGNTCTGTVTDLEDERDRPCDETKGPAPKDGKLRVEKFPFPKATGFGQKVYLERSESSTGDDETIVMSTMQGGMVNGMWKTDDHGKNWEQIENFDSNAQFIVQHQYENDRVFFLTPNSKKVWYSSNRCKNFESFNVDLPFSTEFPPLGFRADHKESMLWIGSQDCGGTSDNCHNVAFVSENRGDRWDLIARYTGKCEFINKEGTKDLIYCEQHRGESSDGPLELLAGENLFKDPETMAENVIAFATMSEFIIVAEKDPDSNLKIKASVDGKTFANASFPHDFNVPHQTAYTLLDSSTHTVFLHVTVGSLRGFEYGRIMKSNGNGTSYVLSIDKVNRNTAGYVDFEKMLGLEGVALVNVVANTENEELGEPKQLQSFITHNDGAAWAKLNAPETDNEGKKWSCDTKNKDECSLHLHSYTERDDPRDTFSSPSAIGIMMGVGNVGKNLKYIGDKDETYTFITTNAGVDWKAVMKGNFMWEYGDQGSLIVIVEKVKATKIGYYSINEGESWTKFSFTDDAVEVMDLTTVPSDNSKQFLLWVKDEDGEVATINVDFSSIRSDRVCDTDHDGDHMGGDYYLWSPKHPLQETECLFGHTTRYLRKNRDADCWNGPKFEKKHGEQINCSCTAQDFECDYNFEPTKDGLCKLVDGLEALDHEQACRDNPSLKSYFKPEGYRKIFISTCSGGKEENYLGQELPCPGHEKEFEDEHPSTGLSGLLFFLVVIVLPVIAAVGIGYGVWTLYQRGGGGFGRIQLGDGSPTGSAFDAERPWVKYPVAALSGLVAVLAAVPLVIGASWRFIRGSFGGGSRRYTSRQSFARGRGDYAIVDPDEDELLGDDEDEENVR